MIRPMLKEPAMRYARVLALVAIAVAALAGCGAASSPSDVQSPLANSGAAKPSHGYIVKSSDTIYSKKPPRTLSYPTGRDNDEVSATGAEPIMPCGLVSRGQAEAILGGSVDIRLEPLGPTCVYALQGSSEQVTMVVEENHVADLRSHARNASSVQVAGRTGWCLRYGSTSVAVPLADGVVLHVTGPCAVASRFAALAVPRVHF
jgi:hypothetical protein